MLAQVFRLLKLTSLGVIFNIRGQQISRIKRSEHMFLTILYIHLSNVYAGTNMNPIRIFTRE